jgi:hypothetical protein
MADALPKLYRVNSKVPGYQTFARAMGLLERNSSSVCRPANKSQQSKWRRGMWKAGLVGGIALVIGSSAAIAGSAENDFGRAPVAKSEAVMSMAQVARLKSVLKLTAAQEQLWPAIERAFHEVSQAQEAASSQGLIQGIKNRATSVALNGLALRRLATAASPLLRTLDEEQKQSGLAFARSVGLHSVAAAF